MGASCHSGRVTKHIIFDPRLAAPAWCTESQPSMLRKGPLLQRRYGSFEQAQRTRIDRKRTRSLATPTTRPIADAAPRGTALEPT